MRNSTISIRDDVVFAAARIVAAAILLLLMSFAGLGATARE
jgi:hypothetical protein